MIIYWDSRVLYNSHGGSFGRVSQILEGILFISRMSGEFFKQCYSLARRDSFFFFFSFFRRAAVVLWSCWVGSASFPLPRVLKISGLLYLLVMNVDCEWVNGCFGCL